MFIRLSPYILDDMNPIVIVAGFVVLLALLLYYMYKEKVEGEAPPRPPEEPAVVEVKDYEAQPAAEEPAEAHEAEQPEEPAPQPEEPEAQTDDLESLSGVGETYRALLRAAGVRSVATLAGEEPTALLERLREANDREGLAKRLPRIGDIEAWVSRAREDA
jgi:predicted flap endonuclease-1-like 5' DNA nuclease